MIEPKPVAGMSDQAAWSNRLREFAKSLRLLPGRGYRLHRWPEGYTIEFDTTGGGGPAAPSSPISLYIFQSHGLAGPPDLQDYVIATPQLGGASVNILKPPLLRFSLKSHGNITYSLWDPVNQQRTALGAGTQVVQTITPNYIKGDVLYVQSVNGVLCDLNVDNRTFAGP